jgi:hypothetical protein
MGRFKDISISMQEPVTLTDLQFAALRNLFAEYEEAFLTLHPAVLDAYYTRIHKERVASRGAPATGLARNF